MSPKPVWNTLVKGSGLGTGLRAEGTVGSHDEARKPRGGTLVTEGLVGLLPDMDEVEN